MKKLISLLLTLALLCLVPLSLASCGDDRPLVGIIQFGTHGSLNNCYDGIIAGLADAGITEDNYRIEHLNSNFSAETSLAQAQKLVNSGAAVIIAIATPSAIQAATAATGKNIPVVYCAVTDATTVGGFENMTGTSDIPDFGAQLSLVTSFMGRSDLKIGVLMSTEESSDAAQITALRAAAASYSGMEILTETVADISTLDAKTDALIAAGADCFVNLLDNTIVGKLQNILTKTNAAGIPVFGSEIEQVKDGCLAAASIDYITVGRLSGAQAAELLGGKKVSEVPKKTMENETFPCYNSTVFASFSGLTLPEIDGMRDVAAN